MLSIEQVVDKKEAAEFLKRVEELDDAYFIDRSKHFPNISLDSSPNKYLSMTDVSMPMDILYTLRTWFPGEIEELLVNRYYPGMSIGPHRDGNPYKHISVMFLNEGMQVLSVKDKDQWIGLQDVPGQMVTFGRDTVHKVSPVDTIRHSIIILREKL